MGFLSRQILACGLDNNTTYNKCLPLEDDHLFQQKKSLRKAVKSPVLFTEPMLPNSFM